MNELTFCPPFVAVGISESASRLNGIICTVQGCGQPGLRSATDAQCRDVDRILETFEQSVDPYLN